MEKNYFLSRFMNDDVMSKSYLIYCQVIWCNILLFFTLNDEDESLCYHVMNDYGR
jgi:hypothetical protein